MDLGYGSHVPVLARAMLKVHLGPVLEMGAGMFSTPLLHEMCEQQGRELTTAETDARWLSTFDPLRSNQHRLVHVVDWDGFLAQDDTWSIVLVDHAPGERRAGDIVRLRDRARLLIVHDTEEAGYRYEPILSSFRYRFDYKKSRPWTTVLSMTETW